MFCGLVIFIKKIYAIKIRRPWAPEITRLCSEVIRSKTFNPIKTRPPIWFRIFFSKACFSSWPPPLLHLGCFWLDFTFFWSLRVRVRFFNDFHFKAVVSVGVNKYCKRSLAILALIYLKSLLFYSYSNDCSPSCQFYTDLNILQIINM